MIIQNNDMLYIKAKVDFASSSVKIIYILTILLYIIKCNN